MKALIQRVLESSVTVNNQEISQISSGLLVLLGIKHDDTEEKMKYVADKISNLRIFPDTEEKLNLSVNDIQGEILVVSQFTLYGDCTNGNRPSFTEAAKPEFAKDMYEKFCDYLESLGLSVKKGQFQAMMEVSLINDGPVTLMIEK